MSPEIATSINIHVPFSLSQITMSGLSLEIVLSFVFVGSKIWLLLLLLLSSSSCGSRNCSTGLVSGLQSGQPRSHGPF